MFIYYNSTSIFKIERFYYICNIQGDRLENMYIIWGVGGSDFKCIHIFIFVIRFIFYTYKTIAGIQGKITEIKFTYWVADYSIFRIYYLGFIHWVVREVKILLFIYYNSTPIFKIEGFYYICNIQLDWLGHSYIIWGVSGSD